MMDFHILVVISCVFLASLFSWLFISKFFRRKTFDEVLAEKKALSDKINAQNKAAAKKPKKLQQTKKELKREKKQRQREERKEQTTATELDDSDTESDKNVRDEDDEEQPMGLSKTHVEFDPDPIVLSNELNQATLPRRASNAEKETSNAKLKSNKKDNKKSGKAASAAAGILLNKNEPIAIKVNNANVVEETLNSFEAKPPKDAVELKKSEKEKERKEEKAQQQHQVQQQQQVGKKEKHANKKEKSTSAPAAVTTVNVNVEPPRAAEVMQQPVVKEVKQLERHASPKAHSQQQQQQNGHNNTNAGHKNKQQKKQSNKESTIQREIVQALDKLSDTDSVSVSLLMNLFRRAELNRSEIQILIDYLLNKQLDSPASHSEWSDDICQKLKRQLEEKERALAEEQEASVGIQAKLRELRTEINAERLQMNVTLKSYTEKIQSKDQELAGLSQELQAVNEKLNLERQQFQAKLLREKQAGSQDLLTQLQLMQNEMAHKDKCIGELTCLVNASRQAVEESQQRNDIIQTQAQQIRALEQQRDELEQVSNNRIFELEKAKELETENSEIKVELRNLQNALESASADITQAHKELEAIKTELTLARNVEINEKQQQIQLLQAQNAELQQQLTLATNKNNEQQSNQDQTAASVQAALDALRQQLGEKEKQLADIVTKNTELQQQNANSSQKYIQQQQELQQRIETLSADAASKHKQLQDLERVHLEKFTNREKELMQQLQEQKDKNNQQQFHINANSSSKDDKQLRELLQRLYPEAVKACAGSALSLPFDQWIEQVLAAHVKQLVSAAVNTNNTSSSSSHKSTQSNGSSHHSTSHNSSQNNNNNKNNSFINDSSSSNRTTNKNSTETSSIDLAAGGVDDGPISDDPVELQKENVQLRVKNEELTRLLMKTSNVLSDLEGHAREQDENWRSIVRSKDEQISALQFSNGEQGI